MNKIIRQQVLERDEQRCQFDKLFGITGILGISECSDQLQVHHVTYERYGHELLGDLVTLCTFHHDYVTSYIRRLRYLLSKDHAPIEYKGVNPTIEARLNRSMSYEELTVPPDGDSTGDSA